MAALKGTEIIAFLAKPDAARPIILLYGPDVGLVRERADALIASAIDDPADPFAMIKMEGDDLAAEPSRLIDEAMTIPLFGGRRAIRVRAGSRPFASGVETLTTMPLQDCRIVIEAGDLRPDAPLRKVCERAKTAVAIPCFVDKLADLERLIDSELHDAKLTIGREARSALASLLGGDRMASRNEIRKLALYAAGSREITLQDIEAIVTDASGLAVDTIVDGAFAGRPADVETAFGRAMAAGTSVGTILFAANRQAALLHKAALLMDEGASAPDATERGFPRLHFSRKPVVEGALRNYNSERLAKIIVQLGDATLESRMNAQLGAAIVQRALMAIAANARRK